jgi:hypothetical protein
MKRIVIMSFIATIVVIIAAYAMIVPIFFTKP